MPHCWKSHALAHIPIWLWIILTTFHAKVKLHQDGFWYSVHFTTLKDGCGYSFILLYSKIALDTLYILLYFNMAGIFITFYYIPKWLLILIAFYNTPKWLWIFLTFYYIPIWLSILFSFHPFYHPSIPSFCLSVLSSVRPLFVRLEPYVSTYLSDLIHSLYKWQVPWTLDILQALSKSTSKYLSYCPLP